MLKEQGEMTYKFTSHSTAWQCEWLLRMYSLASCLVAYLTWCLANYLPPIIWFHFRAPEMHAIGDISAWREQNGLGVTCMVYISLHVEWLWSSFRNEYSIATSLVVWYSWSYPVVYVGHYLLTLKHLLNPLTSTSQCHVQDLLPRVHSVTVFFDS